MFDRNRFKWRLAAAEKTLNETAQYLGINPSTLSRKMDGTSDFTRNEIQMLRAFLHLDDEELKLIFFADKLA